ncbi:MAG: 23S rRNA (uracil(1939)-C(5))-methyltransferase RlmD [Atopobiaceae bacterium]|nr:23S rRNA (uracil(1939)-C(5))-methyltransferase RlmD [Atopobiaceae bacterium]
METGTATYEVEVERLSYGADAIARTPEGKTLFIPGGVPGDTVRVEVVEEKDRYARGRILEVIGSSDRRVRPSCPFAGICGGCPGAHVERSFQLEEKRSLVIDALVRIGRMDPERAEGLVGTCVDVGPALGYRNKIELDAVRNGNRTVIGMHAAGGDVVKVDACPLFDAPSKKAVKALSGALGYLAGSQDLALERVGIRSSKLSGEVEVALWTETGSFPRKHVATVIGAALPASSIVRVMMKGPKAARRVAGVECLSGKGFWTEKVAGEAMNLSAPSFFQVNTRGAEKLVACALDGLGVEPDDEAMDLYCGAGTFTLPLARRAGFVSAVESYGPAVRDLRRNLERAGIDNVDAIGGDAGLEFPDTDADVIIVDPPRAGLAKEVVEKLSAQPAHASASVSCDPATLARAIARCEELGTFSPTAITPHDLFPQTFHVESVALMSRTK